jgi:hypothetical protein
MWGKERNIYGGIVNCFNSHFSEIAQLTEQNNKFTFVKSHKKYNEIIFPVIEIEIPDYTVTNV